MELSYNGLKTAITAATFVLAIVLTMIISPLWLLLLLFPLFGLPLAREIGVLKDADERELHDGYRSSHVALYAVMIIVVIQVIDKWMQGRFVDPLLYVLLAVAIAIKLTCGLAGSLSYKQAASLIGGVAGVVWVTINVLSFRGPLDIFAHSLQGLALLAFTAAAYFYPLAGGPLLVAHGLFSTVQPLNIFEKLQLMRFPDVIALLLFVAAPQIVSGALFLINHAVERRESLESGGPVKNEALGGTPAAD